MAKKLITLFLALIMMFSLLACNNSSEDPTTSQTPTPTATSTPEGTDPTEAPDNSEFKLPIVDDKVTFTIWAGAPSVQTGMMSNDESMGVQEVESLTNVHIDWHHVASGQEVEQFNLIIVSQELPDSFYGGTDMYIGGLDKFIEDDLIINIKDIAEKVSPNYLSVRTIDEQTDRDTKTDTGNWPGFYRIKKTIQPTWLGPATRLDLLKKYNIEKPRTYDQFEEMLFTFKNESTVTQPLAINNIGLDETFMAGFGVKNGFIVVDGKVQYGPALPGFGEYIKKMADWYSKGLIDVDFYTRGFILESDQTATGKITTWNTVYTFFHTTEVNAEIEGFKLTALTPPTLNEGDIRPFTINYATTSRLDGMISTVTTSCKDPETFARFMDYFYTEEGSLYVDYGIEGVSYEYVNGKPTFTDLILSDTSGAPIQIWGKYVYNGVAGFYDWERELFPTLGEEGIAALTTWDIDFVDTQSMPSVTPTADESREYSVLFNDIQTFIQENVSRFITGTKPISELDAFLDQIRNGMNLNRVLEIQQAALDRYYSR